MELKKLCAVGEAEDLNETQILRSLFQLFETFMKMKTNTTYRHLSCSVALGLAFLGTVDYARADFALHANDRVVFYGDSITD